MSFQFKSELLEEVPLSQASRYCADPRYGAQEKHNGERRTILRSGDQIISLNREGNPSKALDAGVKAAFLAHPLQKYVIDIELVGSSDRGWRIVVLDALVLNDELLGTDTYEHREKRAHDEFDGHKMFEVVHTTRSEKEKTDLVQRLFNSNAEGVVMRKMDAPYKMGSREQHKKIKFWKELDAVVIGPGHDGHNSVRVGVFDAQGRLQDIGGVSLNGKPKAVKGDVVMVKYLYATKHLNVVQTELLAIRDDKQAKYCTMDQLTRTMNKNWKVA